HHLAPRRCAAGGGGGGLVRALESLCDSAMAAVRAGKTILILSDRGVGAYLAPIPMLLAVGAVHHYLIREGCRLRASLVADSGEPRDVHHFAVLLGHGASAIHPYLALETVRELARKSRDRISGEEAVQAFIRVAEKGLLKVLSKMGISCLSSYHGAQIFEALGLGDEVIDRCMHGTPSQFGGLGFDEVAQEVLARHREAYQEGGGSKLKQGGSYRYRKVGEYHAFNPDVVKALHKAVQEKDRGAYMKYAELVNRRTPTSPRDLFQLREVDESRRVALEELEPVEDIWRRFGTSGMSLGALGPEAHETLAIAMNRIGGRSNSGEGGEDPARFVPRENGDSANSRVKQVASARFGVTPAYLAAADELQIKVSQGSKPGEGGQLPGHKVAAHIAAIRHSVPGVTLISPPPHHDIYSIEDLSQLIYDLKQANPRAFVSVKLVAEAGVGTVAAGVAKAYADVVHISGHDGGTGASPWSSIKNAGSPWELGLAETQQTLVLNELRGRVRLRVDGGLKTGRDVVLAALLGAEEFDFGTAAVVAEGCIMARQCHLNTCPVGVATQNPQLRSKFKGTPEDVITFFRGVAEEVREILASLGLRSLDEAVGRSDLIQLALPEDHPKAATLDSSKILGNPDPSGRLPRKCTVERNERPGTSLDEEILGGCRGAFEGQIVEFNRKVRNVDRTLGARVSGEIAKLFGNEGLNEGLISYNLKGSAGQSLGAFLVRGVEIHVEGEANDYVGKGMGGGLISIRPAEASRFPSHESSIIGNAVLYGATGGELFAAGRAGERFAVRNSGAHAVVEGVGDHGCEYMTNGRAVILGPTGRNFAAGMSGGIAYVMDPEGHFPDRLNKEMVNLEHLTGRRDEEFLKEIIERHRKLTGSRHAANILTRWDHYRRIFWKVIPNPPEALAFREMEAETEETFLIPSGF
ncbi:MAG: glutamate synthase large subunit, partial [Nitrospinota bacterium]